MKKFLDEYLIFLTLIVLNLFFVFLCVLIHRQEIGNDMDSIERVESTGVIRLITTYSVNTYHLYNGDPTGFEYDLAKAFADYMNVDLNVVTPGQNNLFPYLEEGKGDFIAASLAITSERLEQANFSIPYMTTQQHIIHHNLVFGPKSIEDMTFRTIHVGRNTAYHYRLEQLKDSGINFKYILYDNIPAEEFIRRVHERKIKFTVSDSHIAQLTRRYYPDIKIGIPIRAKEYIAWAVNKNDNPMLEAVNKFFLYANETGLLQRYIDRYFNSTEGNDAFSMKKFHERIEKRLPRFKETIIKESEKYGFDWKLVAAVVYQESHFNPAARSFTNVKGLMQVTGQAAEDMGLERWLKPDASIRAGIKYLDKMMKNFDYIDDEYEKMLFALGSYNVGLGHVLDAMKLARQRGLDDTRWRSIKTTLPLLSKPKYYKKTRHGYARGWEPVQYVDHILTYYDILKQKKFK